MTIKAIALTPNVSEKTKPTAFLAVGLRDANLLDLAHSRPSARDACVDVPTVVGVVDGDFWQT